MRKFLICILSLGLWLGTACAADWVMRYPNGNAIKVTLPSDIANFTTSGRTIATAQGLQGGGDLTANRTLSLTNTTVTPGNYTFTALAIDQQGRITNAVNGTVAVANTTSLQWSLDGWGGTIATGSTPTAILQNNFRVVNITVVSDRGQNANLTLSCRYNATGNTTHADVVGYANLSSSMNATYENPSWTNLNWTAGGKVDCYINSTDTNNHTYIKIMGVTY